MKSLLTILLLSVSFFGCTDETITFETVGFKSSDGLIITADLYMGNPEDAPFIILCHQAGWSRGEYLEIAPKLNALGYNCMAIDQRSGGGVNGIINETNKLAKSKGLGTTFIDAEVDIVSTIDFVRKNYPKASKLILWGSSYSSSLALKLAGERSDIDAVLSFAPGEYFKRFGKPDDYITQKVKSIDIPVFITSKKSEKNNWWEMYKLIPSGKKQYFLPKTAGQHGSKALWEKFPENQAYWEAVKDFLKTI